MEGAVTLDHHEDAIAAAQPGRRMLAAERITAILRGAGGTYTVKAGAPLVLDSHVSGGRAFWARLKSGSNDYMVLIPREAWQHIDLEPIRKPPHEPA